MDDEAAALARRALLRESLDQALADALARHLHQTERSDLGDLMLRTVTRQALDQAAQHQVTVRGHHHVDIVDHDHAADVTQTQLAGDFLGRLKIAPGDGFLKALALTDEPARVHVNRGHCLGAVDDD